MGCSSAYAVSKSGKSVALCEQFEIGHTKGSSHGLRRIFRKAYPDESSVEMMEHSLRLWEELSERTGIRLLEFVGLLMFGNPEDEFLSTVRKNYERMGLPHDVMEKAECEKRFPHLKIKQEQIGLFQKDAGVVYASKCIEAFQQAAQSLGAEFYENSRVTGVTRHAPGGLSTSPNPRYIISLSTGKTITCDKIILTAGSWVNKLLDTLNLTRFPLETTMEQVVYFYAKKEDEHKYHVDSGFPALLVADSAIGQYCLPLTGDGHKGFKNGAHHTGEVFTDADKLSDEDREQKMQHIIDECKKFARDHMPGLLEGDKEPGWARCLYTSSPDENMIIGPHPEDENVIVGTGFSGEGFKFGSIVGQLLSEWADAGKTTTLEVDPKFSPKRFIGTHKSSL